MKKIQVLEKRLLKAGNGNPERSAVELVAHVLGCKPLEVYFREPTPQQDHELEMLMIRAEQGEPIQYLIGHVDFRGLEIRCDRRALIPRPETELLVEEVLRSKVGRQETGAQGIEDGGQKTEDRGQETENRGQKTEDGEQGIEDGAEKHLKPNAQSRMPLRIADVGCGTGCIGLALLAELPDAEVFAVDISPETLALARENAERLGLSARFVAIQGDLLNVDAVSSPHSILAGKRGEEIAPTVFADSSLDVVVSNPPYIFSEICGKLDRSVRDYEPRLALDGGADGLDLIRPLVAQAARVLKPGGGLFLEIGYDQGTAVVHCLEEAGYQHVRIAKDYAGLDRIVCGTTRHLG